MKKYLFAISLFLGIISNSFAQTDSLPDLPYLVVSDTTMISFIKSSIRYFKKEDRRWQKYYYIEVDLTPTDVIFPKESILTLANATYLFPLLGTYHQLSFERYTNMLIGYTLIDDVPVLFQKQLGYSLKPNIGFQGLFKYSSRSARKLFDLLKRYDDRDINQKKKYENQGVYMISNFLYLTKDRHVKMSH